ncbi:MAG: hypothetical protein J6X49_10020 [Victivallales bacterium]|nr:hypothetical protein [Victivallales bacterium]
MAFELIYTSYPTGIRAGSSGFCTVAHTNSMPKPLMTILEGLSGYNPLYPHYDPKAWNNPVSYAHCIRDKYHILSRVCFNGTDYTQRSNKLASHIAIEEMEAYTLQGGPSSVFFVDGIFKDANWQIKPEIYEKPLILPQVSLKGGKCKTWELVTGDAGWGGVLAENYLNKSDRIAYIVYSPEQHNVVLKLIHEALALLPEAVRWNVSFNTYCTNIPAGITYLWRCCLAGSDMISKARHIGTDLIIDISQPLPKATGNELVEFARTGKNPIPLSEEFEEEHLKLKLPNDKVNYNIHENNRLQSIEFKNTVEKRTSPNIVIQPEQPDVNNMKNNTFLIYLGIFIIILNLLLFILYQKQINKMKYINEKLDYKVEKVNNEIEKLDTKLSSINEKLDSKISNVKEKLDLKINVLSTGLAKLEDRNDSKNKNTDNSSAKEVSKDNKQSSEKKQEAVSDKRKSSSNDNQSDSTKTKNLKQNQIEGNNPMTDSQKNTKIEFGSWVFLEKLLQDKKCEITDPISDLGKLKISVNDKIQKVKPEKESIILKLGSDNTNKIGYCELIFNIENKKLIFEKKSGKLKPFLKEKICIIIDTEKEIIYYPLYFTDQSSITGDDIIFQQSSNKFTINCSTLPSKTELKLKTKDKEIIFLRKDINQLGTDFIFNTNNNQNNTINNQNIKEILKNDPKLFLYIDDKERLSVPFSDIKKK